MGGNQGGDIKGLQPKSATPGSKWSWRNDLILVVEVVDLREEPLLPAHRTPPNTSGARRQPQRQISKFTLEHFNLSTSPDSGGDVRYRL